MMKLRAILSSLLLFSMPVVAFAQSDSSPFLSSTAPDLEITATPQNPGANTPVSLSLGSSALDLADSSITWYQNGKALAQGTGVTAATVTTGALGSRLNITAAVTAPDGTQEQAQTTIIPTQIDLLFDGNTYVPPFYQGRALPSAGTMIRAQALAYFKRADGTLVPPSQISYTWKEGGSVVGTASGTGRSSAFLPAPSLYGSTVLEVDAASLDNSFTGSASIIIPAAPVQLVLYQDHPLYGIVYDNAIVSGASIAQSQATFAVVPYFAQARSPNDPNLAYTWSVNGSSVSSSAQDPSEITLNAQNSSGQAAVSVDITHATNIFLSAQGSWSISLGGVGAFGGSALQSTRSTQSGNLFNVGQ